MEGDVALRKWCYHLFSQTQANTHKRQPRSTSITTATQPTLMLLELNRGRHWVVDLSCLCSTKGTLNDVLVGTGISYSAIAELKNRLQGRLEGKKSMNYYFIRPPSTQISRTRQRPMRRQKSRRNERRFWVDLSTYIYLPIGYHSLGKIPILKLHWILNLSVGHRPITARSRFCY